MPPAAKKLKLENGEAISQASPSVISVDADGTPTPDPKKSTIKPNANFKANAYKFILMTWHGIALWMGIPAGAFNDLFVSCEISSIIASVHTISRQEKSQKGSFGTRNGNKESTVTYKGKAYKITNASAKDIYDACWKVVVGELTADTYKDFLGCLQPLLFLTVLFKERFKSYRVTPTAKVVGKDGQTTKQVPLSKFGFLGHHVIFMDGMGLPPFITSSLAQSVGTGVVVYNLLTSPKDYAGRWKSAASKHLKHIPGHDDVIACLSERKSGDVKEVVKELFNILLAATPRQTHRAAVPVCMLNHIMLKEQLDVPSMYNNATEFTCEALAATLQATLKFDDDALNHFNNSGEPVAIGYNIATKQVFTIPGNLREDLAKSMVILALFGCAKEDLGLLGWMFGGMKFQTRSEMGKRVPKTGFFHRRYKHQSAAARLLLENGSSEHVRHVRRQSQPAGTQELSLKPAEHDTGTKAWIAMLSSGENAMDTGAWVKRPEVDSVPTESGKFFFT
ncbi:hypothetical protein ONE63_003570 [Megalurothrips usitatus]|uniref:Uncharacterized protein n=1 Tax=Megalurothrips usitatus TaxID=439358 RepID=A0AAV7X985_9NEOP|nr:hypothetical protein ONE63_003570 [Megalurothrips usitatus]